VNGSIWELAIAPSVGGCPGRRLRDDVELRSPPRGFDWREGFRHSRGDALGGQERETRRQ
jgi:hypothetical protein